MRTTVWLLTCLMATLQSESNWKLSGNDCALATSLTDKNLFSVGWMILPLFFRGAKEVTMVGKGSLGCSLPSAPFQLPFRFAVWARHQGIVLFSAPTRPSHRFPSALPNFSWHLHMNFSLPTPQYLLQFLNKTVIIITQWQHTYILTPRSFPSDPNTSSLGSHLQSPPCGMKPAWSW